MKSKLLDVTGQFLRRFGVEIIRYRGDDKGALPKDFDDEAAAIIHAVRPYTMTSPERLFALVQAVRFVSSASVPGAIVECGVWRGGSMMAAARTLLECGDTMRNLYLFDTFEGMSPPTDRDVAIDGQTARSLLQTQDRNDQQSAWCVATLEDVTTNMESTGYATDLVHYVKGKVEDTIPQHAPSQIAILRLDTDWYESTKHELEQLYPRLGIGGVLIIDDYGHWAGCRQAVDEYFKNRKIPLLLSRVDYTGRIAVKTE